MERSLENRKLSGVSIERLHRDKKRYTLPPEYYDVIIDNNGTLGDFEENIIKVMSNKNNQKYYEIDGNSEEQTADIHRMCTRCAITQLSCQMVRLDTYEIIGVFDEYIKPYPKGDFHINTNKTLRKKREIERGKRLFRV